MVPNDPADVPNEGVEMNVTGYGAASLGTYASFQVAAEETIGAYDAVFGLFENSSFGPIGYFEVFTSVGDQTVHLAYGAPLGTVGGMGYRFALTVSSGTLWVLTVNGAPFGGNVSSSSFDFGAPEATVAGGLEFSEVAFYSTTASDVVPPVVLATTALAVRVAGAWYLPENATTRFVGDSSGRWGVEGRDQVASLAPGEIRTGSSIPPLANNTPLWTGGPVPVDLTFTLSSTTTTATLPVVVNATVRDTAGAPLPGVPLSVSDAQGGVEVGGGNLTGALGSAKLELLTPNVSAAETDLVTVASTMLGYSAGASQSLLLTPAIEIDLIASPSTPEVPVNGSITLVFRTTDAGARRRSPPSSSPRPWEAAFRSATARARPTVRSRSSSSPAPARSPWKSTSWSWSRAFGGALPSMSTSSGLRSRFGRRRSRGWPWASPCSWGRRSTWC